MIYLNIVGRGSNWFIKINGCKNGWNVLSLSIIKDEFYDIKLWGLFIYVSEVIASIIIWYNALPLVFSNFDE